jgi:Icc protein
MIPMEENIISMEQRQILPGLGTNINHIVAVSHVSPNDGDFDPKLAEPYETLFNQTPGMLASLHSHQHSKLNIYYQNGTGIPFYIANAIVKRAYTIFEIKDAQIKAEEINF